MLSLLDKIIVNSQVVLLVDRKKDWLDIEKKPEIQRITWLMNLFQGEYILEDKEDKE